MCKRCNYLDSDCCIFQEFTEEWYIYHKTSQWDNVDKDFVYDKIYIEYCPWCGRKL